VTRPRRGRRLKSAVPALDVGEVAELPHPDQRAVTRGTLHG
jgi:hypothetical protein